MAEELILKEGETVEIAPKKKKKAWLKYLLSMLFLALLMGLTAWYLFKDTSVSEIMSIVKTADPFWVGVGIALTLGYILFGGMVLHAIIKSHGDKTNMLNNIKYAATDFYFCAVTPSATGGQPMVGYFMAKDGINVAFTTIVLLLSTAMFKVVLVLLCFVALFFIAPLIFCAENVLLAVLYVVGVLLNVGLIVLCVLLVFKPNIIWKCGKKLLPFLKKIRIVKNEDSARAKLEELMRNYKEGAEYFKAHKSVAVRMLIYTLLQRLCLFSVGYVIALSLGANMDYFQFLSIQIAVAVSVDSLPFPGGVGLSETLMLSLYGMVYPQDLMMPALLLTRGVSYYLLLLITGVMILLFCVIRAVISAYKNKKRERKM